MGLNSPITPNEIGGIWVYEKPKNLLFSYTLLIFATRLPPTPMFSTLREVLDHNRQTQNPYLDLGKLGLIGNEPELDELKTFEWVETLVFSNVWWEFDEKKNEWVKRQSQNIGEPNQLTSLPTHPPQLKQFILAGDYYNPFKISDISFLKDLTNLTNLDLRNNQLSDISFLSGLSALTTLELTYNKISDISFLKDLTNLTNLDLSNNEISDISFLSGLTGLTSLNLWYNQISDISFLQGLSALTTLELHSNKISDISFLSGLRGLTSLNLGSNQISDISFLKELKGLTNLYLSNNQISDFSALKELKGLTNLHLRTNQISDISFLKELKNLTLLNLSKNKIKHFSLIFLNSLPNLKELYLEGNPIQNIFLM